jgi:hypothetical protein
MDLTAYLHPGWAPLIRPAPATRAWMDATPDAFAYRCLPLNIANAHGWEVLSPCAFDAVWDGGTGIEAVTLRYGADVDPGRAPVSLFGSGVITFHIEAIIRTPPGWNLWVGGSPNRAKDGIAPLTGIVETDWAPFTFTMNWRFTRPGQWIHFDAFEPFCFIFPVQRAAVAAFKPAFAPLSADPATEARFKAWVEAHDAVHAKARSEPPAAPADPRQGCYARGVDVSGAALIDDHCTELRLRPFDRTAAPEAPEAPAQDGATAAVPTTSAVVPAGDVTLALAKREWLLETLERQRHLTAAVAGIERRAGVDGQEFLERYYATNRPVILTGEMDDWPALRLWTPDYLKAKVGSAQVQYQAGRSTNPLFEIEMHRHSREGSFEDFIDLIQQGDGNDAYITANNSARNREALAPLDADMGLLEKFLTPVKAGMMWIGPAGTVTSLHHDLTNNFIAQLVGRKRLTILPAADVGKLYNYRHVFSQITDLDDPSFSLERYPNMAGAHVYEVVLEPGEILFMPVAWWHQVTSLDFSVTVTHTNFLWPNDAYATFPKG